MHDCGALLLTLGYGLRRLRFPGGWWYDRRAAATRQHIRSYRNAKIGILRFRIEHILRQEQSELVEGVAGGLENEHVTDLTSSGDVCLRQASNRGRAGDWNQPV